MHLSPKINDDAWDGVELWSPTLLLEVYHPVGPHFNPNLAHLILLISSSMSSLAVEWGVLCLSWVGEHWSRKFLWSLWEWYTVPKQQMDTVHVGKTYNSLVQSAVLSRPCLCCSSTHCYTLIDFHKAVKDSHNLIPKWDPSEVNGGIYIHMVWTV